MNSQFSQIKLNFTMQDFLQRLTEENVFSEDSILTFAQPLKVKLKKTLFEDDFTEKDMIANLLSIRIIDSHGTYFIDAYFDFQPYEDINFPLLTDTFYPNKYTSKLPEKELYNALEAQCYNPNLSVYLGNIDFIDQDFSKFVYETLDEFLEII